MNTVLNSWNDKWKQYSIANHRSSTAQLKINATFFLHSNVTDVDLLQAQLLLLMGVVPLLNIFNFHF